jgi:hypothetical protein
MRKRAVYQVALRVLDDNTQCTLIYRTYDYLKMIVENAIILNDGLLDLCMRNIAADQDFHLE